jgi:hypothetical protein
MYDVCGYKYVAPTEPNSLVSLIPNCANLLEFRSEVPNQGLA